MSIGDSNVEKKEVKFRAFFVNYRNYPFASLLSIAGCLLLWELISGSGLVSPLFLPAPSVILKSGWEMVRTGEIIRHIGASMWRVGWGFAIGASAGILVGFILGLSSMGDSILNPLLAVTYPIPKIAILPLLILWLGIGEASKTTVIALGVFFPIAINVRAGIRDVDPVLIRAAISMGATRFSVARKAILPCTLPMLFAGLKVSMGIALLLVVTAEMVAAESGIGFLILSSADLMQTDRLLFGIMILSVLGLLFNWGLNSMEKILIPWKHTGDKETAQMNQGRFIAAIKTYGRLIKLSHTIFALPFALGAVVLGYHIWGFSWTKLIWIICAMTFARSAAMGFNRWADIHYDRMNPRTSNRPSVTGQISPRALIVLVIISSALFVLSSFMLGKLCFALSFPVLGVLLFYSYTKRFTSLSHFYLGFAIGLAPAGGWIAATGIWDYRILWLSVALMTFIAGFDILYALQDIEFDKKAGLYSLPARYNAKTAFWVSSLLHAVMVLSLLGLGQAFRLTGFYWATVALIGILLFVEHWLVRPHDLSRINMAFFHVNSAISLLLFLGIFVDRIATPWSG